MIANKTSISSDPSRLQSSGNYSNLYILPEIDGVSTDGLCALFTHPTTSVASTLMF